MFSDFPQFVPQKVCLSCRGCCRFREAQSVWRPKVAPEEIEASAYKNDLTPAPAQDGRIRTVRQQGQNCCTFLDLQTNQCGIYAGRPFECRLYPFLLMKKNGGAVVGVHLSCPYVQEFRYSAEFEKYTDVLKMYLSGEKTARFLRGNPALAGDYSAYGEEIEELFPLEAQ